MFVFPSTDSLIIAYLLTTIEGELRQVSSVEKRINEARRMGFSRIIIPNRRKGNKVKRNRFRQYSNTQKKFNLAGIDCIEANNLMDAIDNGLVSKITKKQRAKKNINRNQSRRPRILC